MHGQKKRRKRSLEGSLAVGGVHMIWELLSEPQWTTEHGYKGLCFSVRSEDTRHRELILEYAIPKKLTGIGVPQLPQRPKFSDKTIEADTLRAIAAGWEPMSRGKSFVFKLSEASS